jgi:hypothetical protein
MDPSFLCKPQTLHNATRIANWCKFEETWDQWVPLSKTQDYLQTKLTQKFTKIETTRDEKFNEEKILKYLVK